MENIEKVIEEKVMELENYIPPMHPAIFRKLLSFLRSSFQDIARQAQEEEREDNSLENRNEYPE